MQGMPLNRPSTMKSPIKSPSSLADEAPVDVVQMHISTEVVKSAALQLSFLFGIPRDPVGVITMSKGSPYCADVTHEEYVPSAYRRYLLFAVVDIYNEKLSVADAVV